MNDTAAIQSLLQYSDNMNRLVFGAAAKLAETKWGQPIDIGLGSLGRILLHIYHGELVWLARWEGKSETAWPPEDSPEHPGKVLTMLEQLWPRRDAFIRSIMPADLGIMQTYRDSRGSLFKAMLRDLILQGVIHSTHHRAQAVNAIKRLGGEALEMDYMASVRQPA